MGISDEVFERVYVIRDWYDGPRRGIADYRGIPHTFNVPGYEEEFVCELSPIDDATVQLALEADAIWRRFHAAKDAGELPSE